MEVLRKFSLSNSLSLSFSVRRVHFEGISGGPDIESSLTRGLSFIASSWFITWPL